MVLENTIDRFISKIEMGRDFFLDAGQMLVKMVDEEPQVFERILSMKRVDWLTMDVLRTFEAIGRKQLAVEAMFLPSHVISHLITLPVDQQVKISANPVPVYTNGSARRRTEMVVHKPASRLTQREAKIALGPEGIRPIEEQKKLAEEKQPERVIGYYEVTVMNNRAFIKQCEKVARAQKVKLDSRGQIILEVVSE